MSRQTLGFTLIELLVTLIVLSLLLAMAAPAFASLRQRTAVTTTHNLLLTGFATARNYSVSFQRLTTICPGTPASGCRDDGVWEAGWLVFVDINGDGRLDADDTLVHHENLMRERVQIRSGRGRPRATFRSNGGAPGTNLTLRICFEGQVQSALILSNPGRARTAVARELAAMSGCD